MNTINFPDDRLKVHGLHWFGEDKPVDRRLPERLKGTFRQPVWDLAQCPAGGRIRFRTDSQHVSIRAKSPDFYVMNHITRIGQSGFDVYVDGLFMGSVSPDEHGVISADWTIAADNKLRGIEISMPLYKAVTIESIGIDDDAVIKDPAPYRVPKPVVYYGTSITQGGCASTPGTTYQSFISRWLDADFVNLGFSGNGFGEPELAAAVSEIDASCFVIDFWANVGAEAYGEKLPGFVGPIRENHPEAPIIVVAPFFFTRDAIDPSAHDTQRNDSAAFVKQHQQQGDKHIHFFDGLKMISREDTFGLVDGVHPNSLGFYLIAKGFTPFIKHVLGL
jgi:lysophospholipase L1-like esterase